MPQTTNSYAFYADYSQMAACLFAIQTVDDNGGFDADEGALLLINAFDQDVLRKLYNRTLMVLGIVNGNIQITEDFLKGDFDDLDFSSMDFHTGYLDTTNTGYSSRFQTILNIFAEFKWRHEELGEELVLSLNDALIPVIDTFEELQQYLEANGINPCGQSGIGNYYNNSSGLYLQAAGSDGSDGSVEGIHLRWSLAGELGDLHFPKGNYAQSQTGYNKPDDFVYLEKTEYNNPVITILDLATEKPVVNFGAKRWTYVINTVINGIIYSNTIKLNFIDSVAYDQIAASVNAKTDPYSFLADYNELLEIDFDQKTIFSFETTFNKNAAVSEATLKLEALCLVDGETIGIRDTVVTDHNQPEQNRSYRGDNISKLKIKATGGLLSQISFETYQDFLNSRNELAWESLGNGFALTLNDNEVADRLETPGKLIDNLWPHYNDGTRIKAQNYLDKWAESYPNDPSIKDLVEDYITFSETDPRAMNQLTLENPDPEQEPQYIELSYLDMLNLQAVDYHMARMLGLGYIDLSDNSKYVYRIKYTNKKSIGSAETITHSFLSLPTGKVDSRLPAKPSIRPVSYQLLNENGEPIDSFDLNGYAQLDNVRIVNIGREAFSYENIKDDFFQSISITESFNIFEKSKPVLYGIEYRPVTQQNYVKPEITNQDSFGHIYYDYDDDFPVEGLPETAPVPDNIESLYLHFEREEGIHFYAIYGINLFSRVSETSNEVATDETAFPLKNSLVPPTDITVQYIQEESTLLFTTGIEQDWLTGREETFIDKDTAFTRINFNWLDITDVSYLHHDPENILADVVRANKVRIFFKEEAPSELRGVITRLQAVPGHPEQLLLRTGAYSLLNGAVVEPVTQSALKYINAILTTDAGQFKVVNITEGANPSITIEKIKVKQNADDTSESGYYSSYETFVSPILGSRFSLVENLGNPENWQGLVKDVTLTDFIDPLDPVIETSLDGAGNVTSYLVGGIHAAGVVSPLLDDDDEVPAFYTVKFASGVSLAPNPQINLPFDPLNSQANNPDTLQNPHVEWYMGLIRIPLAEGNEKKLLEVNRIVQYDPLILYVYDPTYATEPIAVSEDEQDEIAGLNFHPGYKAYIFSEPLPESFNRSNIYPQESEISKKTMLALQSCDMRIGGSNLTSRISEPVILLARQIVKPLPPERPKHSGLKVRPDETGKAAFTFDVGIKLNSNLTIRKPFGFFFYRLSNEDLLNVLYKSETVNEIQGILEGLTEDEFFNDRYLELADVIFDPSNPGNFRVFPALPMPFGFPVPDNESLDIDLNDDLLLKTAKYKQAVRSALLPLTEQVPIYEFIDDRNRQTENKPPVIRDIDGNLLNPSDEAFEPYPMIRKFTSLESGLPTVRFTDYHLNGTSRFLYFYTASETNNQLVSGPLSPFAGPVEILQTQMSEAPLIRSVSYEAVAGVDGLPQVGFALSAVSSNDNFEKVRIFRSRDKVSALTLKTMDSYTDEDFPFDDPNLIVNDSFENFGGIIPFGETIYYRLAFIRFINNEDGEEEEVLSLGSDIIEVRLVDGTNPLAPEIDYDDVNNEVSWEPTVYKGTYYLYKQNSSGNWDKLYQVEQFAEDGKMIYSLPEALPSVDEDGDPVYHRFKVRVENESGLFNLAEDELTISN